MRFTKMHGLGNDYVYVDGFRERVADPSALARRISDRHTGVGSDGLILILPSNTAAVRMVMFNADGSRSQMCGNGIRCVAKYAADRGLAPRDEMTIETDAGIKRAWCEPGEGAVRRVRIDMGSPSLSAGALPCTLATDRVIDQPFRAGGREFRMTCVSMGNPHAVVFCEDVHRLDLPEFGPLFENAPIFPERINAHFARVDAPDRVTVRTWERGAGATRACGTGACAVCVAGAVTRRTKRRVTTCLPGGELDIDWSEDDRVYMAGPAEEVFSGEWSEQG